jgi:sec-independent protein translocase protein TatA
MIAMFMPGMQELIIIAVVILLLFGGKKLPELMRGMGEGITSFKKGLAFDPDAEEESS